MHFDAWICTGFPFPTLYSYEAWEKTVASAANIEETKMEPTGKKSADSRRGIRSRTRRSGENGQAITEMTVGLVALMAVFLGMLAIGALAVVNVQTLISARGEADERAVNGVLSESGRSIIEWSYGTDGLLFTADDRAVRGGSQPLISFRGELVSDLTTDENESYIFNPANLDGRGDSYTPRYNFALGLPDLDLFISAANLTSGTTTVADPMGERGLGLDVQRGFQSLVFDGRPFDFSIRETVYMPDLSE
jgi:hypothetical protein